MFSEALRQLDLDGVNTSQPESLVGYCRRTSQAKPKNVPALLYIQHLSGLRPELREANVMIFRLGSPPGKKFTYFGLSRVETDWSDYFFIDETILAKAETRAFIPTASYRDLYAFSLFPKFTETTLVNFALASGLIAEALDLESTPSIPITGRSTYTFEFHPRRESDALWCHQEGQVEIDGVFIGRRNGRDWLFILEAKYGGAGSLAKTKLLYPYWALREHVPQAMPVSLVYLRASIKNNQLLYNIAECNDLESGIHSPLDLSVSSIRRFTIKKQ